MSRCESRDDAAPTDSDYCESLPPWRLVSVSRASEPSVFDALRGTVRSNHYHSRSRLLDLLNGLHGGEADIERSLVLTESEIEGGLFEVRPFRESDAVVLWKGSQPSVFERDRASLVVVSVFVVAERFTVAGNVADLVPDAAVGISLWACHTMTGFDNTLVLTGNRLS